MFLANPETEPLARCEEGKQQTHTNVYKIKQRCSRKPRVRLCRRASRTLNTPWEKNLLGIEGVLLFPCYCIKQEGIFFVNVKAARKCLPTSEPENWSSAHIKFKTKL